MQSYLNENSEELFQIIQGKTVRKKIREFTFD